MRGLQGSCGLWSCHRAPWRCSEVREQSDRTGIAEDAKQEEMPTTKVVLELEMQAPGTSQHRAMREAPTSTTTGAPLCPAWRPAIEIADGLQGQGGVVGEGGRAAR